MEDMPIKISHEVPLSLLPMSTWFNDYDYALVHLLKNDAYRKFYEESIQVGRMVILDNSLYELGKAFNPAEYAQWIEKLKPTYYIIPDTFWDSVATIHQAMQWMVNQAPGIDPKCKPIGVAQGATYQDIVRSYKFFDSIGVDYIAFTFKFDAKMLDSLIKEKDFRGLDDGNLYGSNADDEATWEDLPTESKQSIMRYWILDLMNHQGVINRNNKHHLLGLQNTMWLNRVCKEFEWVTSIDTSNPIIYGLEGYEYHKYMECYPELDECVEIIGNGFDPKPARQLKDFFDKELTHTELDRVRTNVNYFRKIVRG